MPRVRTQRTQDRARPASRLVVPPARAAHGVRALTSVLKTFAVLDVFADAPAALRLADVARLIGGNRGSVYQKLMTLVAAGWLEQTDAGEFRLTLRATRMGEAALRQVSLGERAQSILKELVFEVRETASLAMLDGSQVFLVRRVEADGVLRADLRVGTELTLDSSASGRILCAFADPLRLQQMRREGLRLPSEEMMARIRRERVVTSSGRDFPGVIAIGAPVFNLDGACIAALSIVAPDARYDEAKLRGPLGRAAERLTALLRGDAPGLDRNAG